MYTVIEMNHKGFGVYLNSFLAALTCPCHAIFYVYILSGTTLGAFLFEHEIIFMSVLGFAFPFFIFMVFKSYQQFKTQKEIEKSGQACDEACKICTPKNT